MPLDTLPSPGYHTLAMSEETKPSRRALAPYAGRWVALVRGQVTGVGRTAEEALWVARLSRPRDKPELLFIPPEESEAMTDEDHNP
ncbi:MAG: hypothetical protein N2508_02070 [Anaerolineae bacterium]|nr:hypothetical protein [Anaerolineae bacterium]